MRPLLPSRATAREREREHMASCHVLLPLDKSVPNEARDPRKRGGQGRVRTEPEGTWVKGTLGKSGPTWVSLPAAVAGMALLVVRMRSLSVRSRSVRPQWATCVLSATLVLGSAQSLLGAQCTHSSRLVIDLPQFSFSSDQARDYHDDNDETSPDDCNILGSTRYLHPLPPP